MYLNTMKLFILRKKNLFGFVFEKLIEENKLNICLILRLLRLSKDCLH